MLLSQAKQTLDDVLAAHDMRLNSVEYGWAFDALVCEQPSLLNVANYNNQASGNIVNAVNRNEADLITVCEAFVRSRSLFTPAENLDRYVFPYIVGVNDAGRAAIARAKAHFARLYEVAL